MELIKEILVDLHRLELASSVSRMASFSNWKTSGKAEILWSAHG